MQQIRITDRTFALAPQHYERLKRRPQAGGAEYQLQLACLQLNDPVPFRFHWPLAVNLSVNGVPYRVYSRAPGQKLGTNARDEPASIGMLVRPGGRAGGGGVGWVGGWFACGAWGGRGRRVSGSVGFTRALQAGTGWRASLGVCMPLCCRGCCWEVVPPCLPAHGQWALVRSSPRPTPHPPRGPTSPPHCPPPPPPPAPPCPRLTHPVRQPPKRAWSTWTAATARPTCWWCCWCGDAAWRR